MVDNKMKFLKKSVFLGDVGDLKEFIKQRTNTKLVELGYKGIFVYDKKKSDNLEWFYHLTGGHTHTDFFAIRPTDYSKANEGENWDDLF